MNYYLFKTEQEAIAGLDYVNQVGLTLFPPERVTPEGIISLNALTGLPDLNAAKTTSWDTVKELVCGEEVIGWYFTVPTDEAVGMALPPLEIPGEYEMFPFLNAAPFDSPAHLRTASPLVLTPLTESLSAWTPGNPAQTAVHNHYNADL